MALPNITLEFTNNQRVALQHAIWPVINNLDARPFDSLTDSEKRQLRELGRLNSRLTIPSN